MNEKLAEALGYVEEKFIAAAARRKKRRKLFLGFAAAVLALVMLVKAPTIPFVVTAKAVSLASDSRIPERPKYNALIDDDNYDAAYTAYRTAYDENESWANNALADMSGFFQTASAEFLNGSNENMLWSPVNAAIALSVLAETASGTTRQEVLDLLGVEDVKTLRQYITGIWEMCYQDDGNEICVLANSLWLVDWVQYDQNVMDILAYDYFSSVYQGDLESRKTSKAIQTWVNNQTGGFLNKQSNGIDVSSRDPLAETAMALVSTVYLRGNWYDEFSADQNTNGVFHSPGGDRTVTYMNMKEGEMDYYWGESYGAVRLGMKNGTAMWLLLPDEGRSTDDVLANGEYLQMLRSPGEYENSKYMKVNLSVPKFDISADLDLRAGLQQLGLEEVFDENGGDFGNTFITEKNVPIFINQVKQASRVSIDEQGVTAASYIVLGWGAGAMAPPDDTIDFILDRPFVFAIATGEGIPLFMGVVNEP